MEDSQSPIICVTCQRPFPDDLKAEDSPRYFGQFPLLPKSDDAHDFGSEVRHITEFISAIADVLSYGDHKEVEQKTYDTIFRLIGELSEEALRRITLSLDAMEEIWKRDHGKSAPTRNEGRA